MPRFTRQPSATKNKIKAPAKTAINPHGSVVAVVLDVSELVPVSVVIVAVLVVVAVVVSVVVSVVVLMMVVVLDVAELVPVSVVVVAVLVVVAVVVSVVASPNTYAEPESVPWSSSHRPPPPRGPRRSSRPPRNRSSRIGPHHHAGPVGAHGHRGTEVVVIGPITRHKLQQPLAGGPVEHVRGARIGALVVVKFAPHHHAGPVGAHGHRGTETVVSSPITRHKLQQPLAGGPVEHVRGAGRSPGRRPCLPPPRGLGDAFRRIPCLRLLSMIPLWCFPRILFLRGFPI
ncbi:unnamed protein product [Prorocentrum cordatum]|uniref:Uncharacterized protein n=1 Tax=Prorocentrum cordatum TaxID=2364126 RepID=A0ABN9UZ48_9DINO|nr:unnamed protein product [Polarella glacialis]